MKSLRSLALLSALALVTNVAHAQVGTLSNTATVTLNATQASTLAVTANTPSTSIASIGANTTTAFSTPVNVTTAWNLTTGTSVRLVGWFASPSAALSAGPGLDIPSSRVEGKIGAAAYAPFTGAAVAGVGVAGGSLQLASYSVVGNLQGSQTDDIDLQLNFAGQPAPQAGSYTGTLNLRAVVQ